MNGRRILLGAAAMLVALIGVAFVADSIRLASGARQQVELADQDMQNIERRLVGALTERSDASVEVGKALSDYAGADAPSTRRQAFDRLAAAFQRTMAGAIDPTNPLERKFMDDVAGAVNRRMVAQKPYDAAVAEYRAALSGVRGAIARWWSADFRAENE